MTLSRHTSTIRYCALEPIVTPVARRAITTRPSSLRLMFGTEACVRSGFDVFRVLYANAHELINALLATNPRFKDADLACSHTLSMV